MCVEGIKEYSATVQTYWATGSVLEVQKCIVYRRIIRKCIGRIDVSFEYRSVWIIKNVLGV